MRRLSMSQRQELSIKDLLPEQFAGENFTLTYGAA